MHTIAVIGAIEAGLDLSSRLVEIAGAWPGGGGGAAARFETLSIAEALARIGNESTVGPWDACLFVFPPRDPGADSFRLLDSLQQALVPGVVLLDGPAAPLESMELDGLITRPVTTPSDTLGTLLYALCRRQSTVRALQQTLRLTQSIHGEAASQMNQLHDELLLASRVQREFLPKALPTDCGLQVAVLFRPAGFVSGDIYDVTRLDEHHIGFFLADAMGHGVPAALMTIFIAACLPQKEIIGNSYHVVPPGEALARLNRYLFASRGGPTRFATAVCGQIDTRTGIVSVASAGHPPALRIGADGLKVTQAIGTLLGALPDAEYTQETFELEPGEVLLVHSDGVESAFPETTSHAALNQHIGDRRPGHAARLAGPSRYLERLVSARQIGNAGGVAGHLDRLAEDLDRQRGSMHQLDDVTVLAFERTPRGFGTDRRRHARAVGSAATRA